MIKTQVILARQRLRANQLVLCAGEHGFGLAARMTPLALSRLHTWQEQGAERGPVIALITRAEHLYRLLSRPPSPLAARVMERCWPGPLLLALPGRPKLSPVVAPEGRVLVQMSAAPPLQELPSALGEPVVFQTLAPGTGVRSFSEAVDRLERSDYATLLPWEPEPAPAPGPLLDLCGEAPHLERAPAPESPLGGALRALLSEQGA